MGEVVTKFGPNYPEKPDIWVKCRYCKEFKDAGAFMSGEDFATKRRCRSCRKKQAEEEYVRTFGRHPQTQKSG